MAVPLPGASPELLLRSSEGEPRGFWARDDRWVAHVGALATFTADADGDRGRFQRVREAAATWAQRPHVFSAENAESRPEGGLRFYGGFSFREDHRPSGFWEAFAPALFLLPSFELEGAAGGASLLRARALVPSGADLERTKRDLENRIERLRERWSDAMASSSPSLGTSQEVPAESTEMGRVTWDDAVSEALQAIRRGGFRKVVLARTMDVTTAEPLDPVDVVGHLWRRNPRTHVFLFEPKAGRALLGAAPETVATVRRGLFHATAVAGSIARGANGEEQRMLADRLLASEKDRAEHRIAVEDMVVRLERLARAVRAGAEPHVLTLARIQHLETEIRARVPQRSVLELLEALHPTPAVCGLPRDAALEFLRSEEPFDRGWYAGPVGFFDEDGNGVFAPALRTAVAHGRTWRLFAGAGIVEGSQPSLEWEETRMKLEPVLSAFGASGARIPEELPPAGAGEPSRSAAPPLGLA